MSPTPSTAAGLLVVDKPGGLTSHDVVARVRRLAGTRKVGHAGTLDPMATGVLVLGLNRATRLLGHLTLTAKGYDATVRLGTATTTDDAEGEVIATAPAGDLDVERVREAFAALVGEIDQVPSSVSAVKVGGQRAYRRVRAGEEVTLPARRVRIDRIDVRAVQAHDAVTDVQVSIACSSGTYVRAIARDVGHALGVGGHLTALRRTAVGPFTLADAVSLADLEAAASTGPLPLVDMADVASRVFPVVAVDEATARSVSHGQRLALELPAAGPVALLGPDGGLLALYERGEGQARAVAVLA